MGLVSKCSKKRKSDVVQWFQNIPVNSIVVGIAVLNTCVIVILSVTILISRYDHTTTNMVVNTTQQTAQNIAQSIETVVEQELNNMQWIREHVDYGDFKNTEALQYMTSINSDIALIGIYNDVGELLAHTTQEGRKIKKMRGQASLSFFPDRIKGSNHYYISPPHVNNMFQEYYPWVVTIISKIARNNHNYYIVMDVKFHVFSQYIDRVLIGDQGYIFIADEDGHLLYHPHQKLLNTKLKQERVDLLPQVYEEGMAKSESNIYASCAIEKSTWNVVGVSNIKEQISQRTADIIYYVSFIMGTAIIVSVGVIVLVVKGGTSPIERLMKSIKKFESDVDAYVEIDVTGIKEIKQLQYSFNHMAKRIRYLMEKVVLEEKELRKAELKALQAQINPHFLYNTLDSIFWLCEEKGNKEAANMVAALSNTFRISISRGKDEITIANEIKHVESYLIIQKIRYQDQFTYEFVIAPEILEYQCLKILLQPFVENAIYHGLNRMVDEGHITIRGYQKEEKIILQVTDNGIGMDEQQIQALYTENSDKAGVGVKNVHNRLQIYYGQAYGVFIRSELDEGTEVTIELPVRKEDKGSDAKSTVS